MMNKEEILEQIRYHDGCIDRLVQDLNKLKYKGVLCDAIRTERNVLDEVPTITALASGGVVDSISPVKRKTTGLNLSRDPEIRLAEKVLQLLACMTTPTTI